MQSCSIVDYTVYLNLYSHTNVYTRALGAAAVVIAIPCNELNEFFAQTKLIQIQKLERLHRM